MRSKRCPIDDCNALIPLDAVACHRHTCQECGEAPTYSRKAIRCLPCHKAAKAEQHGKKAYIRKMPASHGKVEPRIKPRSQYQEKIDQEKDQQQAKVNTHVNKEMHRRSFEAAADPRLARVKFGWLAA